MGIPVTPTQVRTMPLCSLSANFTYHVTYFGGGFGGTIRLLAMLPNVGRTVDISTALAEGGSDEERIVVDFICLVGGNFSIATKFSLVTNIRKRSRDDYRNGNGC